MRKHLHQLSSSLLITMLLCLLATGLRAQEQEDTTPKTWEELALQPDGWTTSSTEISITSAEELAWVAKMVNESQDTGTKGEKGFEGVTITLTTDLDLAGHLWIPIGKAYKKPFKGSFDGDSKKICNMEISTDYTAGLFGQLEIATIQNILLVDCSIEKTFNDIPNEAFNLYAGSIAGIIDNTCTIQNCSAKGNLTYPKAEGGYLGGIVGFNGDKANIVGGTTIKDCHFEGSLSSTWSGKDVASACIGGITGQNLKNGIIENCTANIKITSVNGEAGGITCTNNNVIQYCQTKGEIYVTTNRTNYGVGGIATNDTPNGKEFSIKGCSSSCNIYMTYTLNSSSTDNLYYAKVGGIIGQTTNKAFTDCTTSGKITVHTTIDQAGSDLANYKCYVGGIVGYSESKSIINCTSSSNIVTTTTIPSSTTYIGGIIGGVLKGRNITNCCIATGNISFEGYKNYCGGIIGYNNSTITNCQYDTSKKVDNVTTSYTEQISGISVIGTESYIGGIAGSNFKPIKNSYSTANIISRSSKANCTGGLVGFSYGRPGYKGEIVDCYTTGNISSTGDENIVGGIVGYNDQGSVNNCYAIGHVEAATLTENSTSCAGGIIGKNDGKVNNCLGLNTSGISNNAATTGRIVGSSNINATFSNNYAHPEIPGEWEKSNTKQNGLDWDKQTYPFAQSNAWDFTDQTHLPKLKSINDDGSYSTTITDQPNLPLVNLNYYTITFDTPKHGTLTVTNQNNSTPINTDNKVLGGTPIKITALGESEKYVLQELLVNGQPFTSGEILTITDNTTIAATFKEVIKEFTVTFEQPEHGTLTVTNQNNIPISTGDNVLDGTQITITANANEEDKYELEELLVNSQPFTSGGTFTVTGNITISATFKEKPKPEPEPEPEPKPEPKPEPEPSPTIYYIVTLPEVEGAVTDPSAGNYEVEAWGSFRFYLTLDEDYNLSAPVVTTDRGETLLPRESDGAYNVPYVRSDVEVFIDGIFRNPDPVANESIQANAIKAWAEGSYIHIHTPQPEAAYVYTFEGKLLHSFTRLLGHRTISLPGGNYIVVVGGKRFKVQTR